MCMDKIKIRVSWFVVTIIELDAVRFNFVKSDDSPNRNKLLNKLIPTLLHFKKVRRNKIKEKLKDMGKDCAEEIFVATNQVVDDVYFNNSDLDVHSEEIWILPTKESITAFDEIFESELKITALSFSEYLRGLLNEYVLLPHYKREELLYFSETSMIQKSCADATILNFKFENEQYRVFPFECMFGFLIEVNNYVVGYDIKRKQIRAFPIAYISELYVLKEKFNPSDDLLEKLNSFFAGYEDLENKIIDLGEGYEDRRYKTTKK